MKIKVNTETIAALNPCVDRFDNWKKHYLDWSGDVTEFLELEYITHHDKLWVSLRLVPRFLVEVFAIDCAVAAAAYAAVYAAANAAAYAVYAAAYAADVADATYTAANAAAAAANAVYAAADYVMEQETQLKILTWLIKTHKEGKE